jgi:hypothetical protein
MTFAITSTIGWASPSGASLQRNTLLTPYLPRPAAPSSETSPTTTAAASVPSSPASFAASARAPREFLLKLPSSSWRAR